MIKNKIKKIFTLSNIFLKDSYQDLNIIDKNNKINKKSIYFWMIFILFFSLFFVDRKSVV